MRSLKHFPSGSPDSEHTRLTRWLLVLCVLAITHGSLYPWIFQAPARGFSASWQQLWSWMDRPLWTTGGDVVGNVILFVPLGMLAWRAAQQWSSRPWFKLLVITTVSVAFALALQILQIWLPRRSAAVSDVVWNALGIALGIPTAAWLQRPIDWLSGRLRSKHLLAYGVTVFWLLLQWWPLLPQLNRSVVKAALAESKQLRQWEFGSAALACLALLLVMHLLRDLRGRRWVIVGLVLTSLVGTLIFVQRPGASFGMASNSLGWCIALVIGHAVWALPPQTAHRWMLLAAAVGLLFSALQPGVFSATPTSFELRPMIGLLSQPRVAHTSAFLWQGFWVLLILLLAQRMGCRMLYAAAALTVVTGGLEVIQRWLPGQQADITPLLLPMAGAWLLTRWSQRQDRLHRQAASTMAG
jgi:VanZ family protein